MSQTYISDVDRLHMQEARDRLSRYFNGRVEVIGSDDYDKINAYGSYDGQLLFVACLTHRNWRWGAYPTVMVSEHHIEKLLEYKDKCELVMFVVTTDDGSMHVLDIGRTDMTQFRRAFTGRTSNPRPGEEHPLEWMRLPPPYVFKRVNEQPS